MEMRSARPHGRLMTLMTLGLAELVQSSESSASTTAVSPLLEMCATWKRRDGSRQRNSCEGIFNFFLNTERPGNLESQTAFQTVSKAMRSCVSYRIVAAARRISLGQPEDLLRSHF
jgi:hypothetical protein